MDSNKYSAQELKSIADKYIDNRNFSPLIKGKIKTEFNKFLTWLETVEK